MKLTTMADCHYVLLNGFFLVKIQTELRLIVIEALSAVFFVISEFLPFLIFDTKKEKVSLFSLIMMD